MADKVTLASVATFQNDTSAVATINNNNALITTALDNTLSRDGTAPNTMSANLDMNSNQILNLPSPATVNSPARLVDVVTNPTISVPAVGTSGAVVGLLNANKTDSGNNTFSGNIAVGGTLGVTGVATFTAIPVLPSASIPTAAIQTNAVGNTQLRQGVARSIVGVTGNATANVADIQGTTRQVLAVNIGGTAVAFAQPQGDQLLGTTTADSATAGNVGEYIESVIASGSAVNLTTATPANVTSIVLTAGDWDVELGVNFIGGATTVITNAGASVSTSSATLDLANGHTVSSPGSAGALNATNYLNSTFSLSLSSRRFSTAGTTVYLVVQSSFTTSTLSAYGILRARRVR